MSRLHILAGGQCVLHEPVPAGSNAVGVPWKTALVNSGLGGKTILPSGTGPGQIDPAESAQIASGDLYEVSFTVDMKTAMNAAQRQALMDAEILKAGAEAQAKLVQALRFFGLTR